MDRKRKPKLNRELIGFFLLAALLLSGLLSSFTMTRCSARLAGQLDDAAWAALSEDWDAAVSLSNAARTQWQAQWKLVAAVSDHSPMEEIDALFRQLSVYAALRESGDFAATCGSLSVHVTAMGDAHRLSWWNLM